MRLWLTVLGLVALIVVAGSTIWWLFIASFGDRQVTDLIARAAKDGTTITVAEQERSGFPLDIRWHLRGIRVAHQSPEGSLVGQIPELVIEVKAWQPQHLTYTAAQLQPWQWQPTDGGAGRSYTVGSFNGQVEPWQAQPGWRGVAELQDVAWRVDGLASAEGSAKDVSAEVFMPLDRQSADFKLRLIQMAVAEPQAFGQVVESAFAFGTIAPIPKDLTPSGLIEWQQSGGMLSVTQSEIVFGALQANASGKVALDQTMRPAGKLKLKVINPELILPVASREGWVEPDKLGYAQMAIGLFSRRNASGVNELNTSLEMREGGLWIGPARLVNLKPVVKAK